VEISVLKNTSDKIDQLIKTIRPKHDGFDYLLLVQQVGCFLPDLFLAAYTAGHCRKSKQYGSLKFLAAYAAGHC
jgi:hypothetical protein